MTTYRGYRDKEGRAHIEADGQPLDPRLDLCNHSPSGFEWGYGGSGPAQAALAILAHRFGDDERALRLYQRFKWDVVARLEGDWQLTGAEIDTAIKG